MRSFETTCTLNFAQPTSAAVLYEKSTTKQQQQHRRNNACKVPAFQMVVSSFWCIVLSSHELFVIILAYLILTSLQ